MSVQKTDKEMNSLDEDEQIRVMANWLISGEKSKINMVINNDRKMIEAYIRKVLSKFPMLRVSGRKPYEGNSIAIEFMLGE